jgi:hypothetical protein
VLWRTGDALHDATLDAAWDFATRPGRYMNDPRMQRANAIAVQRFRQGAPTRRPRPPARGWSAERLARGGARAQRGTGCWTRTR